MQVPRHQLWGVPKKLVGRGVLRTWGLTVVPPPRPDPEPPPASPPPPSPKRRRIELAPIPPDHQPQRALDAAAHPATTPAPRLAPDHAERRRRVRVVANIAGAAPALSDELGELSRANRTVLARRGWRHLVESRRGRPNIPVSARRLPHRAARLLGHLHACGQPVALRTAPWTVEQKDAAVARGPHPSAVEYTDFLRGEMLEMCRRRQWIVLPYSSVRHRRGVRISPPGVIPQRERRPRTIVDYTWSGVNPDTIKLAPQQAMQFGRAFWRILYAIYFADPRWGPVHLLKADVSDGFYQVWLALMDILKLGLILPGGDASDPDIAFPLSLPMGWVESPPAFCSVTETGADLANAAIRAGADPPPHRHDTVADTPTVLDRPPSRPVPTRRRQRPIPRPFPRGPVGSVDVYVDDFIGIVQGGPRRRRRIRRILFHAIDEVLRPNDAADAAAAVPRKDPISVKKLLKGDGAWETVKVVLGWLIDTVAGTVELPPHRIDRLHELLAEYPRSRRRAGIRPWHKLLGELRSMVLGIPGCRGCFSILQAALQSADGSRVKLSTAVHDQLDDLRWLAQQPRLPSHPHCRTCRRRRRLPRYRRRCGSWDGGGMVARRRAALSRGALC